MIYTVDFKYIHNLNIRELGLLIEENDLFEKTYVASRFKSFIEAGKASESCNESVPTFCFNNESIIVNKFSVVIASVDNNKIGILILENYSYVNVKKFSFTYKKNKKSYSMLGFMGIYIKPEYRGVGISVDMIAELDKNINSHIEKEECFSHVNFISASSSAYTLASKYMKGIHIIQSASNDYMWKEESKSIFSSIRHIMKHH